jgi:hypothetical protein
MDESRDSLQHGEGKFGCIYNREQNINYLRVGSR